MATEGTINAPEKPTNVPILAQWLGGQGIGGWFYLEAIPNNLSLYRIIRYSPKGIIECDRVFTLLTKGFNPVLPFQFTYISHCAECNVIQGQMNYRFLYQEV